MITLFFLLIPLHLFAQDVSINWNQNLRKEIEISCLLHDEACLEFCHGHQFCKVEENYCRDCIGTSLRMSYLLDNLGREITNKFKAYPIKDFFKKLGENSLVSMTQDDVYNIIDAYRSLQVYEKFSKLCPEGSTSVIIFFSVDTQSRRLQKPEAVYCKFLNHNEIYHLETRPTFIINFLRHYNI